MSVNNNHGEGQWRSYLYKSCVLVYIMMVIVGRGWIPLRIKGHQESVEVIEILCVSGD